MDPSKLLDFLKLSPRHLAAIVVITGAIVFLPDGALMRLGIAKLATDYKGWFGVGLLASTALLAVSLVTAVLRKISEVHSSRKRKEFIEERLHNLTEGEKQILRYYIAKNTRSNRLRIDDGTVRGLASSGIIYRSASVGNLISGFDHNISDAAWRYLCQQPELLLGDTNTYRTDKNHWDDD